MAKLRLSACLYISVFILIFSSAAFAASITYTYDSLNRIIKVDYEYGFTEDYTYDAAGNRLTLVVTSKRISGTGENYPESGFIASLSLAVRAASLETSWLNYYYAYQGIDLASTLITGLSIVGNTITITGECTVNGVAGYTFTVTITDGSPDTMEIIIYNSDGSLYFSSGQGDLSSGDYIIEPDILTEHQLKTSVSLSGAGSISPDCSGVCWYDNGNLAVLTANEDSGYPFNIWIGCDSPFNNICTMTMDADKTLTAVFDSCQYPARAVGITTDYYSTIQEAYDAAVDGDTIQTQALTFTEDLNINIDKSVTLEGGYDCNYSAITGNTTLNGNMTISDGTITTENLIIGN